MKRKLLLTGVLGIFANSSWAAGYDTLPAGVNMVALKQVMTSKIESKYDSNHQDESLSFKENFTSNKLENINNALKTYFQELKAISPDAYDQLSLGEFEANAFANVTAQGFGFARGMSDHFTVYSSVPLYHIKTSVNFGQSKKSNIAAIQGLIANAKTDSATSTFVKQLTMQLPETNEQLLQSMVVNYYGYKPLGTWEKDALGDLEVGAIYRLSDFYDKGLSIAGGFVFPTGDADDPDSLQDVPTGDGQYDAFAESNAGISFFDNKIQFDLKTRFTYQFASRKVIRTTDDPDLPLSRTKEMMKEKLGNKLDSTFTATVNPTEWLNFHSSFIYSEIGKTRYASSDSRVNSVLELNTSSSNQWARVGFGLSSVELYKMKRMDIPCELSFSAQKLLNAKNSANYERFDMDFRLYF